MLKYQIKPQQQVLHLAADCPQVDLHFLPTKVSSIDHVSLPRLTSQPEAPASTGLVEVASTRHNLKCVGAAVSVGQPVLLQGGVGVGKTGLVAEWAARTGRRLVTLQVYTILYKKRFSLLARFCYESLNTIFTYLCYHLVTGE